MSKPLIWAVAGVLLCSVAAAQTALPGLNAQAEVFVDADGVPHIYAQNRLDSAYVLGYIHASQRFFQMDLTRRTVSGTLAELVGGSVLQQDIELRTLGLRRAALRSYRAYDAHTRAILQAYANGVNAWLANNPLPIEYGVLEISKAEPWTPIDTIVVGKGLAFQLSFDLDIQRTIELTAYRQAGQIGGFDGTALFFQDTHRSEPMDGRVSIPNFLSSIGGVGKNRAQAKRNLFESRVLDPETIAAAREYMQRIADIPIIERTLSRREQRGGSNWWIVSGDKTASGFPVLSNDPHLSLNLPPVFFEAHIVTESPAMNVTGVTLPGAPGVILGCNTRICWGATTNPMDVTDTYSEVLRVNSLGFPTATVHNGNPEPVVWIFQSYFVNPVGDGEMDNIQRAPVGFTSGAITFVVPRRNHGPIVSVMGDTALSVAYTGWGPTQELKTFLLWNEAKNLNDFKQGLKFFDFGSQNWAYADVSGNIAYFTSGELPLREDLQKLGAPDGGIPPYLIRDGSGTLAHGWLPRVNRPDHQATPFRVLPQDEMPHVVNPAKGYIANANNDPIGTTLDNNPLNQLRPGGGIYYLNPGYSSLRMGRIDRVLQDLTANGGITAADMAALQANNQLLDAELMTPFIVQAFENAQAGNAWPGLAQFAQNARIQGAVGLLGSWDYSTPTGLVAGWDPGLPPGTAPSEQEITNSAAATIFSVWRGQYIANTIDGTLSAIGLSDFLPGSDLAYSASAHLLTSFDENHGVGASGIPFFNVPDAPDATTARDVIVLKSLADALALLFSEEFAPAFGNATTLTDLRWGKLHRIVFDHPLGGPFSIPNGDSVPHLAPDLPGFARSGGFESVDAASHSARADELNDFMFGGGPARRFIGVMDPSGVQAQEIIPGGQSGNPLDPNYAGQLQRWLANAYHPLLFQREAVEATAVERLQFVPAP